ncbi:MAG: putative N-carbamoyl-L-amino acid hydrolase [Gammaproteobacteria bacterium]|nr:putative N-carbamoyl-L-amino acid hydrolase [Gammaproteobacteria bacterium]
MVGSAVNEARCFGWLMQLGEITDPARPWTRTAFSERHGQGREFLAGRMRELGLVTSIDAAGNLIGRREGTEPSAGTIMIGSHSDTVVGGGRFDGIAGVIAGLEIAAALNDSGVRLRHSLEIVDFLAEEPNEFGLSCIGSRGMAGALDADMLARKNRAGGTLREGIVATGAGDVAARRSDVVAFFELHIEQGPVLEAQGRDVGVVTHIAGIRRLSLTFKGQAAHAGTTPLDLRQDALVAAAKFVLDLRAALESRREAQPFVIATVGEIHVAPNAPNVVPGEARVVVDLRSDAGDALVTWTDRIRALGEQAVAGTKVTLAECRLLSATEPTICAPALTAHLREAARELGLRQQDIVSGAGHDAAFLSKIAPAAMLFVPSRDGMSHCAQEWTDSDALAKGVAAVLRAVRAFDG